MEDIYITRDVLLNPNDKGIIVSNLDKTYYKLLRLFVHNFMKNSALKYNAPYSGALLLDIAPQDHSGALPFETSGWIRHTADLDSSTNPTYVIDITANNNELIASGTYDAIVCTEVLEHTLHPFNGMKELSRLLKKGGLLFLSVPCNFRMHGPLPDSWRFTEYGIKNLINSNDFEILELTALETPDRPLFPIDYTLVARKLI